MSLDSERLRLKAIQDDRDRWNLLSEEERGRWLHQDKWGPYNKLASMLTSEEANIIKSHKNFRRLRVYFDKCTMNGSPVDLVRILTDMFYAAVGEIR